ncbi:MAG: gamma carbonic anhydrase family protein [Geothrix sp.]|uniref:gamma carbonic anhydrase family protein n=1 Tax=Geothrix sp. TaxID=1962974 RepID=UPI00180B00DD|nr:gamma carbonic anhydrase family protein [Geothrix sp.]NWJ40852.1 gamma carbonic anhydrase family protein [Geothrix sp.]WIL21147.1 MAG: gamma carbonic anhydrase family protein [Geothrix sp.]
MIRPFQGMVPQIGSRVFIPDSALILGDVSIGDDVSIWFNCVIRGDVNWIRIGARANIQDACCLHVSNTIRPLLIEEEVSVAHNVMLHGCTIRRGALIGMSTTIMDGAEIGEGCLVAAGSLVREGFQAPPHSLVAGWPAVVKGPLSDRQREIATSVWARYVRYKEAYFADGWPIAEAPKIDAPRPGFAEGHPYP